MYCGKCGSEIENGAKFCPKCGSAVKANALTISQTSLDKKPGGTFKSKKLTYAVVGVVVVFLLFLVLKKDSAEDIALTATKAIANGNVDKYYKLLADPYIDYMVGSDGWFSDDKEFKEVLEEDSEEFKNMIEYKCGEKYKVEYNIRRTKEYEDNELNYIVSALHRDYDYDPDKIRAVATVTVQIKASGDEGRGVWTHEISCVKIGGSWKIHRPGFY